MLAVAEMPVTFAERLRELRAGARLSRDKLAKASGLTYSQVVKLEQGGVLNPGLTTLRQLAAALDVTLDQLQRDKDGNEVELERPRKPPRRGRPKKGD